MSALPAFAPLAAPGHWRNIDFISDLHLTANRPDNRAAFLRALQRSQRAADALFILGDWFDVWIGDDGRFATFERELLSATRAASARIAIYFMPGNRDFLMGPAAAQAGGFTILEDPTLLSFAGQRIILTHGDLLCLADLPYQTLRQKTRSPDWQAAMLARPLWLRRAFATLLRWRSQHATARKTYASMDIDRPEAERWLSAAQAQSLIHGHTHRPGHEKLAQGERWTLSDWDASNGRASLLRLNAQGMSVLALDS